MDTIANDPRARRADSLVPSPAEALRALDQTRELTLALVENIGEEELEQVHSPLMSPLAWDLAHIAAYEDLWLVHRHAGLPLLHPELAELYDAFETPRAIRGQLRLLSAAEAFEYMASVRSRSTQAAESEGIGDGSLHEMVLRHELQHTETMRQTMEIARLLPEGEPRLDALEGEWRWVEIAAGPFEMGAGGGGHDRFSYDNECPRHRVELEGFQIASMPVRAREWRRFCEEGGFERRELWSQAGWAWNTSDRSPRQVPPDGGGELAAACHLSFFEAEAFARSKGARLPSEAEWEKAAKLSKEGELAGRGQVWEWTSSTFEGYPGFRAHPYREYSEVFFGEGYIVLRGGSWATSPRVGSATFRNWDLPQRSQIFSGVRLARDLP